MLQPDSNGVILTADEIAQSRENKRKRRTISQLPVFRNAVLLLDLIVDIAAKSPKNVRKFTDSSIETVNDLMRYIGMAQEYRGEERLNCIIEGISTVYVLKSHFVIYHSRSIISKDALNKVKKLCDNTVAQLYGWRDSVQREGLDV